ncbi:disulfide bond formation protein B [Pseudoroseomonas rhizosphaerae]|uniref:Disulfide bond formation protein B n=1 Tax=Teichococcus rhizosphaerae TaxID=1335062 RepID=A0A2C7AG40_9PROT|nr:disulfide bond formation protein B [Pseudoroseomonas rhizosphaerae]PHK96445.1 disulfide bond formation protein B [Pseudoroseomonas rhizosphaerae]
MMPRSLPIPLAVAALAAAAPLLAMASERWGGLNPCLLCLWQRWPYWLGAVLALLALWLPRRPMLALAGIAILGAAAAGLVHVGVEAKWWPSPLPGCAAPAAGGARSVEDLMNSLAPAPAKPCDEPTYLIPGLPVSMAAMNLVYALGLGGVALLASRRQR